MLMVKGPQRKGAGSEGGGLLLSREPQSITEKGVGWEKVKEGKDSK